MVVTRKTGNMESEVHFMITATILGNISGEVKTGETANGKAYARFMIEWPKKLGEEWKYKFPVTIYGKQGLHTYLADGKHICVSGRIETGQYEKEGKTLRSYSLIVSEKDSLEFEPDGTEGFSNVVYVGNLFGDCTMRYIPNEKRTAVASWYAAVNREWDKEHPDSYPTDLYGERAEKNARKLAKGRRVAVVGSIETYSYKDKEENWHNGWKIVSSSDPNAVIIFENSKKPEMSTNDYQEPVGDPKDEPDEQAAGFAELPPDVEDEYFNF